jgi:F-type H+-transporting ATPase subunit alpha
MKKIAGKLRLDLAQFRELEAFAKFASDLDDSTAAQITRGRRMVEILKQNQYVPMSTEKQVVIIYAASQGYLDDIDLESVKEFEIGLLEHFESKHSDLLGEIVSTGDISDDLSKKMNSAVEEFKKKF